MRDRVAVQTAARADLPHVPGGEARQALTTLRRNRAHLNDGFAVGSLALFGSVARNEARPDSDVDLLVEFARPIGLLHLAKTAVFLEELLGRPVDLVLRRALLPELRAGILAEAVDVF